MKSDTDCNYLPDTHWTQWGNQEDFSFLQSHLLWEHPAVSRLAKLTRTTYWELEYRKTYNENVYWLMIILYPSENLPSYIHDQMAFMNYIQEIIEHNSFQEKEIVKNNTLNNDMNISLEDYKFGVCRISSYWT